MSRQAYILDKAYSQKVQTLLLEALVRGLMDEETKVVALKTGEIIHAFTLMSAVFLADSPLVSSPTKLREFCTDYAKQLAARVKEAQAHNAKHGAPFPTFHIEGDLH